MPHNRYPNTSATLYSNLVCLKSVGIELYMYRACLLTSWKRHASVGFGFDLRRSERLLRGVSICDLLATKLHAAEQAGDGGSKQL